MSLDTHPLYTIPTYALGGELIRSETQGLPGRFRETLAQEVRVNENLPVKSDTSGGAIGPEHTFVRVCLDKISSALRSLGFTRSSIPV